MSKLEEGGNQDSQVFTITQLVYQERAKKGEKVWKG